MTDLPRHHASGDPCKSRTPTWRAPPSAVPRLVRGFARYGIRTHPPKNRLIPPERLSKARARRSRIGWPLRTIRRGSAVQSPHRSFTESRTTACEGPCQPSNGDAAARGPSAYAANAAAPCGGAFGAFGVAIDSSHDDHAGAPQRRGSPVCPPGSAAARWPSLSSSSTSCNSPAPTRSGEKGVDPRTGWLRESQDASSARALDNIVRLTGQAAGTHATVRRVAGDAWRQPYPHQQARPTRPGDSGRGGRDAASRVVSRTTSHWPPRHAYASALAAVTRGTIVEGQGRDR